MRTKTNATIVMRHRGDIHMGTMVWVEQGRAGVYTDGVYRVGDFLSVRVELDRWDQTVMAIAEVQGTDLRPNKLHRYKIRFLEMRRSDRERFEAWCQELAPEVMVELEEDQRPRALDSQVGSNVPEDVAYTVPVPGAPPDQDGSQWDTESTPSVSTSVGYRKSRRQALRAVLRAACGETSPHGREADNDPSYPPSARVLLDRDPIEVELLYPSPRSWAADWQAWLFQGLSFVRHSGEQPELEQPAKVRLILPNRIDITCPARVVVQHTTGFGLFFDLDPHQIETMAEVAREASTKPPRAGSFDAQHDATSTQGASFWRRLFGLQPKKTQLEQALEALPDPLAPLEMDPSGRRQLQSILGHADRHYLVVADEVRTLLSEERWSWPELEERIRDFEEPLALAANLIVLAHSVRRDAAQTIMSAEAARRITPTSVEVVADRSEPCDRCRVQLGQPTTPLALVQQGLPPFHLGCTCRVARALNLPESGNRGGMSRL
jgi:hypothetical protein